MKFTRTVGCAVALLLLFGACKERPQTTQEQAVGCESLTFPIGEPLPTPPFTGEAYLQHLIASDSIFHFPQTNVVTFAPGAHSSWHRHGGMVVLVTDGVGLYQEEGKAAQVLRKGDVVQIPAGVRHWHGATKDNWFSQIVIYDAEWEPEGAYPEDEDNTVSDAYNEALVLQDEPTPTRGDELMFATADTLLTLPTFNGPIRLSTTLDYPNAAGALCGVRAGRLQRVAHPRRRPSAYRDRRRRLSSDRGATGADPPSRRRSPVSSGSPPLARSHGWQPLCPSGCERQSGQTGCRLAREAQPGSLRPIAQRIASTPRSARAVPKRKPEASFDATKLRVVFFSQTGRLPAGDPAANDGRRGQRRRYISS